jgi:hypothetical protein
MEKLIQVANNVLLNTDSQNSVVTSDEFCLPPTNRGDEIHHGLFIDGWPTYWSLDQIRQGYRNSNASLAARFGNSLEGKLISKTRSPKYKAFNTKIQTELTC